MFCLLMDSSVFLSVEGEIQALLHGETAYSVQIYVNVEFSIVNKFLA